MNLHFKILMPVSFVLFLSFGFKIQNEKIYFNEKIISSFVLNDIYGKLFSLDNYKKNKGCIVVFTCNHCPFATLYQERLNKLNEKYKEKGFPLIAINSISAVDFPEENISDLKKRAKDKKYNFPYLVDTKQEAARLFGASKTPHAFVVYWQNNQWLVKYNGAIDDNGAEPAKAEEHYVENAINELIAGKSVSVKETKSIGCAIKFKN